jgi:glycosyltransferase involved in cell wall biosynthesis
VSPRPLVSVCVPVRNGRDLIERALDSALAQDYEPIEIVVADDDSSDGTAELVRSRYGERVRLFENDVARGLCGNHDAVVSRARGDFIKFLHHDDFLTPPCVSRMAQALLANPTAGLAFCRRAIELEDETETAQHWLERYRAPHRNFAALAPVNSGKGLFAEWLARGFPDNWIGEPVTVMVRRSSLRRAGRFNPHSRQMMDIDLWMRILAHEDAAFVDEELVTYRHSEASSTGRTIEGRRNWLDPLWMLEALTADDELAARHPELESMRRVRRREAFRTAIRHALRLPPELKFAKDWARYERYRAGRLLRTA